MYFGLAWFKCFLLLNPLNVKSKNSGREVKYLICYLLVRIVRKFPKTRITREKKKKIFWLIKNEDNIVDGYLTGADLECKTSMWPIFTKSTQFVLQLLLLFLLLLSLWLLLLLLSLLLMLLLLFVIGVWPTDYC